MRSSLLSACFLVTVVAFDIGATPDAQDFRKVICLNSPAGCPCIRREDAFTVYHADAALVTGRGKPGYVAVNVRGSQCEYPEAMLVPMPEAAVLRSKFQNVSHRALALDRLADIAKVRSAKAVSMGLFYPTYYHLALEDLYPGVRVRIPTHSGADAGFASEEFLKQVSWEGSGITSDGRGISYAGPGRYSTYDARKVWAYGSGGRMQVFPYRSLAVNFPGICRALSRVWPGCTPGSAIGILVRIPALAARKIKVENEEHDGYFCAADTGAPYYIRYNRIDIFVGTHGGGNPFLPEERRKNEFLNGGLRALVPSDWRIWTGPDTRVFCELSQLPGDIFHPSPGSCTHDYHVVARDKALEMFALFDETGAPVRCRANPEHPGPGFPR